MQQVFINALIAGAAYALTGLGFALTYRVSRFFNFAHGAVFTCGAYLTLFLSVSVGLPLLFAVLIAMAMCALIGCGLELSIYRPLRQRRASSLVLLLASLGIYTILQNTISLAFGDDVQTLVPFRVDTSLNVFGGRMTFAQLILIGVSISLFVLIGLVIARTRLGKTFRAVASDPILALVAGIESDRSVLVTFAAGSALAGVAAILVSLDMPMVPTMGMNALLMGVVAAIVGGIDSVSGVAVGGLLLGFAQHLGIWMIGSEWQDSIAFAVLLAFLLLRPYGVLGRKLRKVEV